MPNWCENDLYIEGPKERVTAFLDAVKSDESLLDFGRIIPLPQELAEAESGSQELGYRAKYGTEADVTNMLSYPWVRSKGLTSRAELIAFFKRTKPEMMAAAERYKANVEKYGVPTWYEWCCEHWGTKWNAAGASLGEGCEEWERRGECVRRVEINFDTAWSPPQPVILRASELYPELEFELRYFERGMGFSGCYCCRAGRVLSDESGDYFGPRGG